MNIDEQLLNCFNTLLSEVIGVHYSNARKNQLISDLPKITQSFGFASPEDCVNSLCAHQLSKSEIDRLVKYVTIGETYFFRDQLFFEELRQTILPPYINKRAKSDKRLRILSAGCSSGEEAYSVAMLLCELIPDIKDWNIVVVGIDINSKLIAKAREGKYTKWSFRQVPENIIVKYFDQENGVYTLHDSVRNLVSFVSLNVLTDSFPSILNNTTAFDLILCRNMIMYFKQSTIDLVIDKITKALLAGGYFFVTGSEIALVNHDRLQKVCTDGLYYFVKKDITQSRLQRADILVPKRKRRVNSASGLGKRIQAKGNKHIPVSTDDLSKDIQFYYENGQYEKALAVVLEMKTEKENLFLTYSYEIRIRSSLGQIDEAISLCNEYIKVNRLNAEPYLLKALIAVEAGNRDDAVSLSDKVIYLEPDWFIGHYLRGNLLLNQLKYERAAKCFQSALKIIEYLPDDNFVSYTDGMTVLQMKELVVVKMNDIQESLNR